MEELPIKFSSLISAQESMSARHHHNDRSKLWKHTCQRGKRCEVVERQHQKENHPVSHNVNLQYVNIVGCSRHTGGAYLGLGG